MAKMTKGFSFAFQVLGFLVWNQGGNVDLDAVIPEYDRYLRTYVYDKLYTELSDLELSILRTIPDTGTIELKDIRELINSRGNLVSNYKRKLLDKGLLQSAKRGSVSMTLPRFGNYLKERALFE